MNPDLEKADMSKKFANISNMINHCYWYLFCPLDVT